MTRWLILTLAAGILFALLPMDWIETRLGFNPDGGSGLVEFLFAAILLTCGIVLAARMWVRSRSDRSSHPRKSALKLGWTNRRQ